MMERAAELGGSLHIERSPLGGTRVSAHPPTGTPQHRCVGAIEPEPAPQDERAPDSVFTARRAGARGVLLEGAEHEELVRCIRTVVDGRVILGPGVAIRMQRFFERSSTETTVRTPSFVPAPPDSAPTIGGCFAA